MCLSLDEQKMTRSAYEKWVNLPLDDKEVLRYAFGNAMDRPREVGSYCSHIIRMSGQKVEVHCFRIGYAKFSIATGEDIGPVILDMAIDQDVDLEVAAIE